MTATGNQSSDPSGADDTSGGQLYSNSYRRLSKSVIPTRTSAWNHDFNVEEEAGLHYIWEALLMLLQLEVLILSKVGLFSVRSVGTPHLVSD